MSEQPEGTPAKKPRVALWIATGFGLGYLPVAPGTWGSLGGIAVGWVLTQLLFWVVSFLSWALGSVGIAFPGHISFEMFFMSPYVAGTALISLVGVWAGNYAVVQFQKSDPQEVVVDEVSGQLITFLPALFPAFMERGGWKYVVMGFILFRVFDIWKPWPASAAEKWPGGWGIMADDWFAGGYAAVVLWAVRWSGFLN